MATQPVDHWSQDMSLGALARIFYDGGISFDEYRERRTKLIDAVVRGEIRLRETPRLKQANTLVPQSQSESSFGVLIAIALLIAAASAAFVFLLLPSTY
jgi:hypothetical protein